MQPFSDGCRHHHIIDPRTGFSNAELASETVVAPNAALADGLATVVMVLGEFAGEELISVLDDCTVRMIHKQDVSNAA